LSDSDDEGNPRKDQNNKSKVVDQTGAEMDQLEIHGEHTNQTQDQDEDVMVVHQTTQGDADADVDKSQPNLKNRTQRKQMSEMSSME
jgi:hypothetical protein